MTFWVTAPSQGLTDISETQKYETDKNQSAKVIPGTQRETLGDIHINVSRDASIQLSLSRCHYLNSGYLLIPMINSIPEFGFFSLLFLPNLKSVYLTVCNSFWSF